VQLLQDEVYILALELRKFDEVLWQGDRGRPGAPHALGLLRRGGGSDVRQ